MRLSLHTTALLIALIAVFTLTGHQVKAADVNIPPNAIRLSVVCATWQEVEIIPGIGPVLIFQGDAFLGDKDIYYLQYGDSDRAAVWTAFDYQRREVKNFHANPISGPDECVIVL